MWAEAVVDELMSAAKLGEEQAAAVLLLGLVMSASKRKMTVELPLGMGRD